ncbi:MAG: T9SS type A sorting domain-containing protein [Prevotella sp.]|nr:T9SS type A sorting domain-containing protein [Prevotella sp.]
MKRITTILLLLCLSASLMQAQILIGGNVYGGGNAGNTGGSSKVNIYSGNLHAVFAGARMADVGGSSFVHLDGEHASDYILIDYVYGGNDIAGTIGTSDEIPTELTKVGKTAGLNNIDNTWNAFVRISTKMDGDAEAADAQKIYVGQLFGGGNGYYTYEPQPSGPGTVVKNVDTGEVEVSSTNELSSPKLGKTYLELLGGSIVYAYGGGNDATITDKTVICLDNPSEVVNSIKDTRVTTEGGGELLTEERFQTMRINTTLSYPSSDAFQIGRFFGGNNKADMAIRPRWNLQRGKIRNLYGGGNEGRMTSPEGLLLQVEGAGMVVDNVFGGCRKADVKPLYNNDDDTPVPYNEVALDPEDNPNNIPAGYAARVRVLAGHVNNVYGGNDISGNVYAGNTVGIRTRIYGDVYGGGNGSYAYTDNPELKNDPRWSDLYYNPDEVLTAAGITGVPNDLKSVTALNLIRPNAEKVSILVRGDDEDHLAIVDGGLYVGGNSASLRQNVEGIPAADQTHIKIGSYSIIDNVFLGNNGENMIKYGPADASGHNEGVLRTMKKQLNEVDPDKYAGNTSSFSSINLLDEDVFAKYMEGCAMKVKSTVVFESRANGDAVDYIPYTTMFGSFVCGGNVGSMITEGKTTINFNDEVVIYNRVVGGCNNALVKPTSYNAIYEGGLLGAPDPAPTGSPNGAIGDKLELNFAGLKIQPKRWNTDHTKLIWNTISSSTEEPVTPVTEGPATISSDEDLDRRFDGGNIYGGCYTSGIVNGNVVININSDIVDRDILFDKVEEDDTGEDKLYGNDQYHIQERRSGVILSEQGMDVLGKALNVFGGGKGIDTEIWGSTTINLNRGYMFQIFGGSEEGAIGKGVHSGTERSYTYDSRYSTYINLKGPIAGDSRKNKKSEDIAECEFMYGGGFLGLTAGNCIINLGNGRIFDSFAGACNADVLGHTETYVGTNGFPYVRDFVYGGNDLGGKIQGTANFDSRLRNATVRSKVYNTDMLNASAYIEYVQGRVEKIFGGAYGVYDYKDTHFRTYFDEDGHAKTGYHKPFLERAFINFRPNESNNSLNTVKQIYGAGQGYLGEEEEDLMQNSSYILIDVPQTMGTYHDTEIFGAGESGGVGMGVEKATADAPATAHKASAIIDLLSGQFKAVYGGSYQEGVTRRTVVNVPAGSTFKAEAIFGGAYGLYNEYPCDVYEANVNWNSSDAIVGGYRTGLYGGNNNCRRTFYGRVNVNAPVYYDKENEYYATVYGAGFGKDTWSQYTEVNLNNTARVYEVYGGGQLGRVMNKKSVDEWAAEADAAAAAASTTAQHIDLSLGTGYTDTGLDNPLATARNGKKYNTNVIINQGADVCGYMYQGSLSGAYAYGGGLGDEKTPNTGDVHGTTYIALLGGKVTKDLYAAGTVGSVNNKYSVATDDFDQTFIASTNAYIEGGTARNVYGGGWKGSVGYHVGAISDTPTGDVLGETHVVIGKKDGDSFINGIPAIERNAYGGGEGGAVFGTANITMNKGFIGYRRFSSTPTTDTDLDYIQVGSDYYQEKLHDETWSGDGTNRLYDSGCIFGGGYIDNSSVDRTKVKMYGGHVRNALFGGGEIAAVGRGVILATGQDNSIRTLKGIYKAGKSSVELFEGNVHRNVFGGGRGYNNLGEGGTLYSDGYVFGQTEVHVHGGTIGTAKELARENGNVFGGGDIGYVYSAYEENGKLFVGIKDGKRYDNKYEGYYYAYDLEQGLSPENYKPYIPADFVYDEHDQKWVMDNGEYVLTEDCKVLIEPYCRATSAVTINGHNYAVGDYVPTTDLHYLGNKNDDKTRWESLDDTGITIFNAVFAGGNTSSGSSTVYANTTTVFGNATASIHDVYHRDLITLGTGHTGGLYGDGNLTFVDGYRGLNITNYGTDYYNISKEITYNQYKLLPEREADYYQLKYKCILQCQDKDGTYYYPAGGEHSKASTLTIDDLLTLFEGVKDGSVDLLLTNTTTGEKYPNPAYWEQNGVVPVYAGRLMNTIQRADFCGVFGSRMVMQGAQDRVPEIVDHTNYTINRVREVSLNHKTSVIESDKALKEGKSEAADIMDQNPEDFVDKDKAIHGNYFGIYSIVNYLGALTSDAFFLPEKNIRYTENASNDDYKTDSKAYNNGGTAVAAKQYGTASFYDWKAGFVNDRKRNNGTSHNKVALASGVYLELTTEKSTGNELYEKDWGYITGVVELDLINVQPGMGGGFVYAKNVHKVGSYTKHSHNTLTKLNADAVTRRDFTFDGAEVEWETSGNFIHSTQTIIDDCYNVSGKYKGSDAVPAHYWFIKGSVYVYDQYISAYTGAPNAYSETVDIPLTITAASHGTMKLLNVMPNKYAYYSTPGTKLEEGKKMVINDVEYQLNDPINYWDWYLLTPTERSLFVNETYVTTADCKYSSEDATVIPAGTVMLPSEYTEAKAAHPDGVYHVEKQQMVDFDFVYRSSNNMSHDMGYMLTYKVNNPTDWNTWYTLAESATAEKNQTGGTGYEDGPTYHLKNNSTGGILGQREYVVSNLIPQGIYNTYQTMKSNHSSAIPATGQAEFEQAYIVTKEYTSGDVHLNVGSTVPENKKDAMTGYVEPAYICTGTIQLSKTEFIYVGNRMTEADKESYKTAYPSLASIIESDIVPAYYCTKDGKYGGNYYEPNKNYRGLEVWSSMSKSDREQFEFNYDAFDVLIDPQYSNDERKKYQYDSAAGTEAAAKLNPAGYSLEKPVDYQATYNGSETSKHNGVKLENGKTYTRTDFEKLPNEKRHYTTIDVKEAGDVYVVNETFQVGSTIYVVGTVISASTYSSLGDSDKENITTLKFDTTETGTYHYCRENYTVGENTEGVTVTGVEGINAKKVGTYSDGASVPVGLVITDNNYTALKNWQTDFTIHGIAPTETSTLYVSRFSDIFDLSKEKIITVIYEYNYEETNLSGTTVTPVTERHVVNIHVLFKSGIPTVEDIKAPQIVLPGTFVGVREPHVTPGAYEVTGGGWKLFEKASDAESHINGIEYTPTADPLYWYQHGYYLAYYAKTYLGETYSNTVQVSVANYHDLTKVLDDTEHYYYVDNPTVKRNSKIYITDATNGASQLKQFYDLTVPSGTPATTVLDEHVKDCQNLEFIMHTNVTVPSGSPAWTPIGTAGHCFAGNFHGDGYRIDGLDNSLFGHLCGNVYNLGVTGSFTSAGIADTGSGYVENCWINTTGTPANGVRAVFGTPTATGYKRVNCYYPNTLAYNTTDDNHGMARPMPADAFYNGTVAYDLNGFYLFKRYNDHIGGSANEYQYYGIKDDGTLTDPQTQHYSSHPEYCSSGYDNKYANAGYVEDRYGDGDFRYADGVIPESEDERTLVDANGVSHFYPIWPDDYIYFGQMLTYGWNGQRPHEDVPSHIAKNSSRLPNTDESNRVYRAPAYYQSKEMNVAHFNPAVNLVAYSKPKNANDTDLNPAYPGMTAIDFAGHNDTEWKLGRVPSGSPAGVDKFYQPLLDDDGIISITNRDETSNLLAYAPSEENNKKTNGVLTSAFTEPEYKDYYNASDPYRRVEAAEYWTVFGHLVQSTLKATNDHLLVDKQDFNCPISYQFTDGMRMWYQRQPDLFVDLTQGWETVSLPFTAELVSTQDKGEITHFYSKSKTADGTENGAKIGHEYWLREYKGIGTATSTLPAGVKATFDYPNATGSNRTVDNTFLWDYYYSQNNQWDANKDTYQTYYQTSRLLEQYPLLTTAKPYIIGFPGKTFYEFDLSGEWTPQNTAPVTPAKLDKQTISFVSVPGITIGVSDDELTASTANGYSFMPNYMSKKVNGYLMNATGSEFDKTPEGGSATVPFRPYFVAGSPSSSAKAKETVQYIIFDDSDSPFAFSDQDPSKGAARGTLTFSTRGKAIVTTSSLGEDVDVQIVNAGGQLIATFTIQPDETIVTPVNNGGVYIISAAGRRYTKKLVIR